jgi:serine protease Do
MDHVEQQTIETVKRISPAVVSIVISKLMPTEKSFALAPAYKHNEPFGIPLPEQPLHTHDLDMPNDVGHKVKVGGGSGFVVDPSGLIITNKHVVFDADAEYTVVANDEKQYPATVLSRDPINDVAIIKINAQKLPIVTIGDSDAIQLGQTVIAIGNALGLFSNTVSKGIISGLGRKISAALGQAGQIENLRHVIQTDVAINQGNSGGPLVNLNGEVIGINTAIIYGAQNIGFALPINWAKTDLEDLQKYGRIIRPYIGLRYVMLNNEMKEKYALPIDYGALVIKDHVPGSQAVIKDSPADKAGIRENDIILEINNNKLTEKNEVADIIELCHVGEQIGMKVMRGTKVISIKTTLEERK